VTPDAFPSGRGPDLDDAATIEACRRGDRAALERVFKRESPGLERLIGHLVRSRSEVEDLLQTTFLEAIGAFPRYRGEASVRTWLARIAVHVVHAHFRTKSRRRTTPIELLATEPVDHSPHPDQLAETARQLERVHHHLDRLSAKNRIAFILHVFVGHSIEEVAAIVGASRVATKSRIFLARRALLSHARKDSGLAGCFEQKGVVG
jgi:RNA polymerase sigma-70 factor, ECF subfamily